MMFIGNNEDAHRAATQKLMETATYLMRANEALMSVQGMSELDDRIGVAKDRLVLSKMAERYDQLFQTAAQRYFA